MKKSHIATLLIFLIAIPVTLVLGMQIPGKWYITIILSSITSEMNSSMNNTKHFFPL